MLVEDFAQTFKRLDAKLVSQTRPTIETLACYFLKGLRSKIKSSIANLDFTRGFDALVTVAPQEWRKDWG